MATMNISLPDQMRDWVEAQIDTGLYSNNSDYVRDLIRKDQQRADKVQALQKAITEGLESGDAGELDMQAIKQKARAKAGIVKR
ncbi:type II toxin-antitoxin system ParD family antitoxin [Porticoccus sp. GXU_MW_L64]